MTDTTHTDRSVDPDAIDAWLDTINPDDLEDTRDLAAVGAAHDAQVAADGDLLYAVAQARVNGRTWAEIGQRLNMSKQGAHQRFATEVADQISAPDR